MILSIKYTSFLKGLSFACILLFSQHSFSGQIAETKDVNVKFLIDAKGTCELEDRSLSLNNVYFLKDKSLIQPTNDGYRILEIHADDFDISYYSKNGKFKQLKFSNISMEVTSSTKNNSNVDIEASFVLVDGQVAVYWKETFVNRIYKHGIFKLDGDKLVFFCEGRGGITTNH